MTESVSDILLARQRETDSMGRPVAFSLGLHAVLIGLVAFLPAAWFASKPELPAIQISLGAGSLGVKRSGQLSTGGRKVDQVVEPKREPILPAAPPKAVTPDPAATVVKTPPKTSDKPPTAVPTTATAKPATGAKIAQGSAAVETGAKGLEVGLSSSGGGNNTAEMDSCCKEYFLDMLRKVDVVWQRNQGAVGETWIDFVIARNGTISEIKVNKSSGVDLLDFAAQRAITQLRLGPLPEKFTGQRMLLTLKFPYLR